MNITNEIIETESNSTVFSQHHCEENELPELLRVLEVEVEASAEGRHWEMFSIWLATEIDVASGEAEEVGEVMNLSSMKIHYCPFCGKNVGSNT